MISFALEPVCTTTIWQRHLKFPPKFGDVMWCFHITFMQKYLLAIGDFELYTNFSNLVQWALLHYSPFKYFFKNSSKCLEMSVDAYNSSSCKNPMMFFENFEWITLFFILAQFGDLYSNHIFLCSSNPELFPTCSPPFKTLKSRRLDPLAYFWCRQCQPLVSAQNWFPQILALSPFCFCQTNLTTISSI